MDKPQALEDRSKTSNEAGIIVVVGEDDDIAEVEG